MGFTHKRVSCRNSEGFLPRVKVKRREFLERVERGQPTGWDSFVNVDECSWNLKLNHIVRMVCQRNPCGDHASRCPRAAVHADPRRRSSLHSVLVMEPTKEFRNRCELSQFPPNAGTSTRDDGGYGQCTHSPRNEIIDDTRVGNHYGDCKEPWV